MLESPIAEFKATPRPANCKLWIECFLYHHKNRNVPKGEILEAALARLYSRDQIFDAMNYLKKAFEKNHIAVFWEAKDRTEYWRWCDMTIAEHQARIEDNLWFESLPEKV